MLFSTAYGNSDVSEFPQHMDVLSFSMADKPLKMKKKGKSNFAFSCSDNSWMNYSKLLYIYLQHRVTYAGITGGRR